MEKNEVTITIKEAKEIWHKYIERIKRMPDSFKWFFEEELDSYAENKLKDMKEENGL